MKFLRIIIALTFVIFGVSLTEVHASNIYIVKSGDTLWRISNKFHIDLSTLLEKNAQLSNPDLIYPGDKLIIPHQKSSLKLTEIEESMLKLMNRQRMERGLNPLKLDPVLSLAAKKKSEDMRNYEYVAHRSPNYGEPNEMLKGLNIPFNTVKENIGAGHQTADEVVQAWQSSPIHRENYLYRNATHIGIGYSEGGPHGFYWTVFIISRVE